MGLWSKRTKRNGGRNLGEPVDVVGVLADCVGATREDIQPQTALQRLAALPGWERAGADGERFYYNMGGEGNKKALERALRAPGVLERFKKADESGEIVEQEVMLDGDPRPRMVHAVNAHMANGVVNPLFSAIKAELQKRIDRTLGPGDSQRGR